jgi:two-component sensor histidine kinase/PAS domain-containing protein
MLAAQTMNLHLGNLMRDLSTSDFLQGGGAMGAAMRSVDWSATVLGAPETWPRTLQTCLRTLLASRQPMWLWWGPQMIQFYNDALIPLLGRRHPGPLGVPAPQAWGEGWDLIADSAAAALKGQSCYFEAAPLAMGQAETQEECYYTFSLSPVIEEAGYDNDAHVGGVIGIITDETDQVRSSRLLALEIEHRRRIERHQNLLLDELNHRVKNTLATVQAMAMQTLKGVDAPARETFLNRLFALSGQHDLLTLDNWEGASLEGVARRALRPWREDGQEDGRVRFTVEGPAVHLDSKRALALGMGFHELATNAAQYGALSNATGTVAISWEIAPDGKSLKLTWRESGGPQVAHPARRGFGLRLIEHGLARELGGMVRLDFAPGGLVCEWIMTLDEET